MPRKNIMLCYPFAVKRVEKWIAMHGYALVQPKLKGIRAWWEGDRLVSSEGNTIVSVPHVNKFLTYDSHRPKIDGELYVHGMTEQHIRSITGRTINLHPDHKAMKFYAFDIKNEMVQADRIGLLNASLQDDVRRPVLAVPTTTVYTIKEVIDCLEFALEQHFEGVVVRNPGGLHITRRSIDIVKWKPEEKDTYIIAAVHEGHGKYAGTLGALTVTDKDFKGFNVGSFAIDDAERERLWEKRKELLGKKVVIKYYGLTEAGIPPSGVFECVVED